jgi:uncharacterized protein YdhG (YjbR/CyaY superfamily)
VIAVSRTVSTFDAVRFLFQDTWRPQRALRCSHEPITTTVEFLAMRADSPLETVDDYIAAQPPAVRRKLTAIRRVVRNTFPAATERISYRMPAFFLDGVLIYFAAFKSHIGIYPPVKATGELAQAIARYRGPKGNLQLPLDEPLPLPLIRQIVLALGASQAARKVARKAARKSRSK